MQLLLDKVVDNIQAQSGSTIGLEGMKSPVDEIKVNESWIAISKHHCLISHIV